MKTATFEVVALEGEAFDPVKFAVQAAALGMVYDAASNTVSLSVDDEALGECKHCGSEFFDVAEQSYHEHAECIGGLDRFSETE